MDHVEKQLLMHANIDRLPCLPHVLLHLLDICQSENPSYNKLIHALKKDPALYMRVFSAHYRTPCTADDNTSPEHRLHQTDIHTIKSIIVTAAVQQFFSRNEAEHTDFIKQHWQHSVYCACMAEALAQLSHYTDVDEAYTAGLLHDIGQLALEINYSDDYTSAFKQHGLQADFFTQEQQLYHTTHQAVGATLLARYGASNFICDAVRYHHEPVEQILDAHPLVKIVYLANAFSNTEFHSNDNKPNNNKLFESAEQLLGLNKSLILGALEKTTERVNAYNSTLDIQPVTETTDKKVIQQITANDEQKLIQLAAQIRNIALLSNIHQPLSHADNRTVLLDTIAQHSSILFGIKQTIVFLYSNTTERLHALASSNQPSQLNDFSLPLQAGRSLVADTLLSKSPSHTFAQNNGASSLSVIDRQLIGLGNKKGFICLPMIINNTALGALVFATDEIQYQYLWKQHSLLAHFTNEVAQAISDQQNQSATLPNDTAAYSGLQNRIHEMIHEVRNPLSIMNNYLGILSYKLEDNKPAQEDIETIKTEIDRVGMIINRLSENHTSTDETAAVDINTIITDLTHIFQTSLFTANKIQISLDLDDNIQAIQSNANALKQIYTNLIKNAVEALSTNGQIMVYTQDHVNVDGKEHLEICVADDGPGIAEDILPKLFSPVETSKDGDHAGLGLTIVKNLVSELHGSIRCRSGEKGTSFHILLPKT